MQLTCSQQDLARGLSIVSHAVSGKSTLPILAHILLVAEGRQLKLTASTGEMSIHCRIDADVKTPGTTTVPAKIISEYVSSLPASPVTMTVLPDSHICRLQCQRSSAHLHGLDPAEFPSLPHAEDGQFPIVLDAAMLKEVIEQVTFAAANDISRPVFTGVQITVANGKLQFAAADAFRLAVRKIAVPEDRQIDWLVPANALKQLSRILPPTDSVQMMVTSNEHQIIFHTERVDLIAQLLEARFPDFTQVIPKEYVTRAVVKTQELAAAIKSVMPFARGNDNILRVMISGPVSQDREPNTLTLEAAADALGSNVSTVGATVVGPDLPIILNVKYLDDVLPAMEMPEIALEVTTPVRPAVIRPALGPTEYCYVVMAMSTNQPANAPQVNTTQATTESVAATR